MMRSHGSEWTNRLTHIWLVRRASPEEAKHRLGLRRADDLHDPLAVDGDAAVRQRLAISSWLALECRVILLGDELGVAENAGTLGVGHIPEPARNERGTPRLDSAFVQVEGVASLGTHCFVNSDIVLTADLLGAIGAVRARCPFSLVGQTRDLRVDEAELTNAAQLRQRALRRGDSVGRRLSTGLSSPVGCSIHYPRFL